MEQRVASAWTQLLGGGCSSVRNGASRAVRSTGALTFHTAASSFAASLAGGGDRFPPNPSNAVSEPSQR